MHLPALQAAVHLPRESQNTTPAFTADFEPQIAIAEEDDDSPPPFAAYLAAIEETPLPSPLGNLPPIVQAAIAAGPVYAARNTAVAVAIAARWSPGQASHSCQVPRSARCRRARPPLADPRKEMRPVTQREEKGRKALSRASSAATQVVEREKQLGETVGASRTKLAAAKASVAAKKAAPAARASSSVATAPKAQDTRPAAAASVNVFPPSDSLPRAGKVALPQLVGGGIVGAGVAWTVVRDIKEKQQQEKEEEAAAERVAAEAAKAAEEAAEAAKAVAAAKAAEEAAAAKAAEEAAAAKAAAKAEEEAAAAKAAEEAAQPRGRPRRRQRRRRPRRRRGQQRRPKRRRRRRRPPQGRRRRRRRRRRRPRRRRRRRRRTW